SIMKVPVVATVLDNKQIEQYAGDDLARISNQLPGLVVSEGQTSYGLLVALRGIGTTSLNTTTDQSVALNVDGQLFSQGLASAAAMFDMAQVSLLRGPQALFYGKSSPAGVISIKTADPTDKPELIARVGYEFEADTRQFDLIASGPVNDKV